MDQADENKTGQDRAAPLHQSNSNAMIMLGGAKSTNALLGFLNIFQPLEIHI